VFFIAGIVFVAHFLIRLDLVIVKLLAILFSPLTLRRSIVGGFGRVLGWDFNDASGATTRILIWFGSCAGTRTVAGVHFEALSRITGEALLGKHLHKRAKLAVGGSQP
jgi:hypothetical protein